MALPRHASRPAPQGAAGTFSLVVGWLTLPASAGGPEKPSGGDAELARSPFGAVRPKASLSRVESWGGSGCAPGVMGGTFPRNKIPRRRPASSRHQFFFITRSGHGG